MAIQHEAFIDLEKALAAKVRKGWTKEIRKMTTEVNSLVKKGAFADASGVISTFQPEAMMRDVRKYAETVARAAFFLGVSRIQDPKDSVLMEKMPMEEIDAVLDHYETAMLTAAAQAVRNAAHKELASIEAAVSAGELGLSIEKEVETVQAAGMTGLGVEIASDAKYHGFTFNPMAAQLVAVTDPFLSAGSSLVISRSNTFGFIEEALIQGITHYRINEIMDNRTCPVCEYMHGRSFTIEHAAQQAMRIMSTQNPNDLKSIAPWPSQSKAGVAALRAMNDGDIEAAGYTMPPFHPGCRGFIDKHATQTVTVSYIKRGAGVIQAALSGVLTKFG